MKKLKIILNSKIFYIILFFLCTTTTFIKIYIIEHESVYNGNETEFTLKVIDYERKNNKINFTFQGEEKLVGTYYLNVDDVSSNISYGTILKVNGSLKKINKNTIPNNFNYSAYLRNKNIYYNLEISSYEIISQDKQFIYIIKNYITERIEKIDKSGYLFAFILGNKDYLLDQDYENYQNIGIAHLFALSGMHVGVFSSLILKMLKRVNIKLKYLLVDIILLFYGALVGFPASIKRCIIFFIINSFFKVSKIDINNIKVLIITAFLIIMYDSFIVFDVGFLYSILTVFGILYCSNFIKSGNKILNSFKLSLVCFLFSLPITLYSFYSINLLSIFYNMFYIPFVSFIVYPLALFSFIFPFLINMFNIVVSFLKWSCAFLNDIDFSIFYMSFNIWEVIIFYILLVIIFGKKKYKLFICLLCILILSYIKPYCDNNSYVYFFDVGQGDSSLIITPYRKDIILIDTGGKINYGSIESSYNVSDGIITFLKSQGIKKINLLILTHGDYDHMGDAINLVESLKVDKVIFNCGEFNNLEQELIKVLEKKKIKYQSCIKELNIGSDTLYFLNNKDYGNENDNSSVIYTELNNHKFLFMGDAGIEVEKDILQKYKLKDIDVLKVGHHGSKTSSNKDFIDEINPKYSIISVGVNNRYGHPNDNVIKQLKSSVIYRTDQNGSIMFKLKSKRLQIKTYFP